ncbi:shikimate kinase [Candidatus Aerophobetes bacterium]|uniref:Shikimate kinase n=1 Tax=Aerophobetes bacterium TaxID=2030807 RepID=A0A523TGX1_UNCAE|nr:MAG: shikimate kinase [Candidatus Aerophobetes bacterium]
MNIILTGFMGTGKSAVGRKLAKRLDMEYLDTDELIEEREGSKIYHIFEEKGECYFRKVESAMVREVSRLDRYVISTGGGVVLKDENIKALRRNGFIICLTANPEVILKRTEKTGDRPLLNEPDPGKRIKELLRMRQAYYEKVDFSVDTSDLGMEEVIRKIEEVLRKKNESCSYRPGGA